MNHNFTEQLTNASLDVLQKSTALAAAHKNPALLPIHILAASLEHSFIISLLQSLQIPIPILQLLVQQEIATLPRVEGAQLVLDNATNTFFSECKAFAQQL